MCVTASCRKTSLSNLCFNQRGPAPQCSTAPNGLIFTVICTILHCLSDIPDQEQGEVSWSCYFSCRPWRIFWNPLSFSLKLFLGRGFLLFCWCIFTAPVCVSSSQLSPALWSPVYFLLGVTALVSKRLFFYCIRAYMCVYIWVIRKGCLLLLRLCKSSLVAITGFWRKCMRPHKAPVRPFSIHHGCGEPACPVTCAIQAGRLLQGRPAELCPVPNSAQMAASLLYHRTGMWSASGHHTAGGRWSSHVGCRARKGPQGLSRTV